MLAEKLFTRSLILIGAIGEIIPTYVILLTISQQNIAAFMHPDCHSSTLILKYKDITTKYVA